MKVGKAMNLGELLRHQWEGYSRYHQARSNLLIHIVAVPLFLFGTLCLLAAVVRLSPVLLSIASGCIVVALVLQVRSHRSEAIPPQPFSSPDNFMARLLLEQWGCRVDGGADARRLPGASRADDSVQRLCLDENCSQHIPHRFEAQEVAAALAQRDQRIEALESEIARLRERIPALGVPRDNG